MIAAVVINLQVTCNMSEQSDESIDKANEAVYSIDFESIIKAKLDEAKLEGFNIRLVD